MPTTSVRYYYVYVLFVFIYVLQGVESINTEGSKGALPCYKAIKISSLVVVATLGGVTDFSVKSWFCTKPNC